MTSDAILVTGALGLVGTAVVRQLAGEGCHVVATDLDTPANRKRVLELSGAGDIAFRPADLTDPAAVEALLADVKPAGVVHLAALIPPLCYANGRLARRVNVDATGILVRAAAALPSPPRFVLASSIAVYGARNPHRHSDPLTAQTPVNPTELYGALKAEAEKVVTASSLDWVILRLGGVLSATPRLDAGMDMILFEGVLPSDGRLQTVDVRDVATAFSRALTTEHVREVFLIGGDDTHRVLQGAVAPAMTEAMGLRGGLPQGRPGDPDSDLNWFPTDWMDSSRSQEVLSFQHHSLPAVLAEARAAAGWRRWPMRGLAPVVRAVLSRKSLNRSLPGSYADPWRAIRNKWGDPSPDGGK